MFHSKSVRHLLAGVLPVAVAMSLVGAGVSAAESDQQARYAAGLSSVGETDGVGYRSTVAPDLKTVSASLEEGRFVLAPDAGGVIVESATGSPIGEIPASFTTAAGNVIDLATEIAADGRGLTVTPQITPAAATELKDIATVPTAQFPDPVQNGAAAGAGIGALIAAVVCLPSLMAFLIVYVPCVGLVGLPNALVGALIGAVVGAVAPEVIPQVLP
ncbi:hypothetical protein BOX37_03185 [Nocardia mangyaensis]|uniref:DUF8020 domain-containing protein n=1 Tax=Nocardia mangyaensis TaxID=2213200 RepID=A0A1J0VM96_9NOCA|nr:hypothetical protein [Nocardia mangyaensis]APE33133.1 hypothetical protein BOX37_03185 [Nocardia mangyaensis]